MRAVRDGTPSALRGVAVRRSALVSLDHPPARTRSSPTTSVSSSAGSPASFRPSRRTGQRRAAQCGAGRVQSVGSDGSALRSVEWSATHAEAPRRRAAGPRREPHRPPAPRQSGPRSRRPTRPTPPESRSRPSSRYEGRATESDTTRTERRRARAGGWPSRRRQGAQRGRRLGTRSRPSLSGRCR